MVKRWEWHYDGMWTFGEKGTEIRTNPDDWVLASDYDERIAALGAENAKMRAEYPYLNECLRLQARVAVLEAAIGKCNGELGCVAYAALAPATSQTSQ